MDSVEEKTDSETTPHKQSINSDHNKENSITSPPEIRRIATTPIRPISPVSTKSLSLKRYHSNNATLSPDSAHILKSASFPDSDYSDNDDHLEYNDDGTIKKKKRRSKISMRRLSKRLSSDNLMNVSRSISSYKSKAMIKLKNKKNEEMYTDSVETKWYKRRLDTFVSMNKTLNISKKLYTAQIAHSKAMHQFSATIHSHIDLGRNRGQTNKNYFGQYLKMMASTMTSIEQLYVEYNNNLKKWLIEPFEEFDGSEDVQNCVNLKYQYNQIRNNFNNNTNSKNRIELEEIEETFKRKTKELLQKREDAVIWKLVQFESGLADFGEKYVEYIDSKRVINGYDEMKAKEIEKKNQIQNDILHINTDSEFGAYLVKSESVSYSIILFHRSKFPPSMTFLMDCFAPLSSKFGDLERMRFVIVHYKCYDVLEKYQVSIFPTCLIFEKNKVCSDYQAIVGNSEISRDELESIVNAINLRM